MSADDGRLFGVRLLVYGAANGAGEAIVRICARHDAQVVAVDSGSSDVDRRFKSVPGVTAIVRDSGAENAEAVIESAADSLGGLDAVIYCANMQAKQPIADAAGKETLVEQRGESINRLFAAALTHLQNSPGGRLIAVGLLRSSFTKDAQILFESAEQSLAALVRKTAAGSGQLGVTANYIQPGAIMTPESRRVFVSDKDLRDHCIQQSAAQRLGEPLDIAKAALFLVSDDATFISGTGLRVDGGAAR